MGHAVANNQMLIISAVMMQKQIKTWLWEEKASKYVKYLSLDT
jgi:hypothetical protein